MGNDGGSIPTRRELVKEAARAPSTAQVNQAQRELQSHHWTTCPLTQKPLTRPIVSDAVGNLYNKDAILQFLLPDTTNEGEGAGEGDGDGDGMSKADCEAILRGRVKSLRDVVELKFEIDSERKVRVTADMNEFREGWICPVTGTQLGPRERSVYLVPCGHVFAEEAVREIGGDKCLQCNETFSKENIIPILPPKDADKQRLIARAQKLAEQGLTHSLKKAPGSKKRKKNPVSSTAVAAAGEGSTPADAEPGDAESKHQPNGPTATSRSNTSTPTPAPAPGAAHGIKNAATAMLTARVLDEENERKKRRKRMGANDNLESLFTRDSPAKEGRNKAADFMTRGYSIPAAERR